MFFGVLTLAICCFLAGSGLFFKMLSLEHRQLTEGLIRLHIVADSDEGEAQRVKLQVRDEVNRYLGKAMAGLHTRQEAEAYLASHLDDISQKAQAVLRANGVEDNLQVSLERERFHRRNYDTFSLPAGRYQALRITLGRGEGHNWWCVVFPGLCIPASRREFGEKAQEAGLTSEMAQTLERDGAFYSLRFGILDVFGEIQNILP